MLATRFEGPQPFLVAGLAGMALVLGVLAGISPPLAVAAAFGLGFVALVLNDLAAGVALMTALAFVDTLPASGAVSPAKLAGFLLVVSWLAALASRRQTELPNVHPLLTWTLVLFLAWTSVTIVWAEDQAEAINGVMRYAPNVLLIPILFTALRDERLFVRIVWVIVIAAAVTALAGVLEPPPDPNGADPTRAAGTAGDANDLAASLVVGMVLALGLAMLPRYSTVLRWTLCGIAGLCLLGILLTLSRGGLVAVSAAVAAAVVLAGRYRVRALVAAVTVVVVGVGYFTMFAPLPARERVTNVGGGTGRVDLWTIAGRMVADRPLEGVGVGNYQVASRHYLLRPGAIERDDFILTTPLAAHNTWLQAISETGIPGVALLTAIMLTAFRCLMSAARTFERLGKQDLGIVCRALIVALVGYLTAGIFIASNYSKLLWLLLALGPVALAVARRMEREPATSSA